jgi:hypothetical protein
MSVQHQLQTLWCWAACSSSVSSFFDTRSTWGQCALANAELEQTSCCEDGDNDGCNKPWYLDRALQRTGNFSSKRQGPVPWEEVRAEIDAGRPVAARIRWGDDTGHFVVLTGYRRSGGRRELEVQDPWTGSSSLAIEDFTNAYKSSGTWTHTYLTEA